MEWFVWLAGLLIALTATDTTVKAVRVVTRYQISGLFWWFSLFSAWGMVEQGARAHGGNPFALMFYGIGLFVALLGTNRVLDWVESKRRQVPTQAVATKAKAKRKKRAGDYPYVEDYDHERDEDHVEARESAAAITSLYEGAELNDINRLVRELVDEELVSLLRLRNDIAGDIEKMTKRLGKAEGKPGMESRVEALRTNIDGLKTYYARVSEGIAGVHTSLDALTVLARERQAGGAPEAKERAARLLTEVQQNNTGILSARREVQRLA